MITLDHVTMSSAAPSARRPELCDVSFEVGAGSIYGVCGPADSGRTALMRLLGLRARPTAGAVLVEGVNTAQVSSTSLGRLRRAFVAVDAPFVLCGERTVAGNIAMPLDRLDVWGRKRRHVVDELLDLSGLSWAAAASPSGLNDGQRRRVAIARALAAQPRVLLVDEPTAGLSSAESGCVLATLDRARAELGVTVIVGTSDCGDVRKVCDSVAVLAQGMLLESGTVLGLLTDPYSQTAQRVLPAVIPDAGSGGQFDQVADVVLIGHAAVERLIPETRERLRVEITTIGSATVRVARTPVARVRIGLRGARSDAALWWIGEHGGLVSPQSEPAPLLVRDRATRLGKRRATLTSSGPTRLANCA